MDKQVDLARTFIKAGFKRGGVVWCRYSGGGLSAERSGACHSMLRSFKGDYPPEGGSFRSYGLEVFADVTKTTAFKSCPEAAEAFYKHFTGPESPFQLILKNYEGDPFNTGYIIRDVGGLPGNLFYNFVITLRFPTEHTYGLPRWYEMVKAGVHPTLAYWAVYMAADDNPNPNHQSFDWRRVPEEYVANFVNGTPANLNGLYGETGGEVMPCNVVWGGVKDTSRGVSGDNVIPRGDQTQYLKGLKARYPESFGTQEVRNIYSGVITRVPGVKTLEDLIKILLAEQDRLELHGDR